MKKKRTLPFGYTIRNGKIEIDQKEADVICEIFEDYIAGASMKELAKKMTRAKIPYTEKRVEWNKNVIDRILQNRKYTGEGEYAPIIDEFFFRQANSQKQERRRKTGGFFLPEEKGRFDFQAYDYVVDAIDTVAGKMGLIEQAQAADTPVISALGAGNKLDPTRFRVANIYDTSVCPLAKVIRKECRRRGIEKLKVVYSDEEPRQPFHTAAAEEKSPGHPAPGSVAFVPSVCGLIIAGEVIKDLIHKKN